MILAATASTATNSFTEGPIDLMVQDTTTPTPTVPPTNNDPIIPGRTTIKVYMMADDAYLPEKEHATPKSPFLVYLLVGSGGGGHKASARAIRDACMLRYPSWQFEIHNASEIIGAKFGDEIYNTLLEKNMTYVMPLVYSVASNVHPYLANIHVAKMKKHFQPLPRPDVVVSLVPFSNIALIQAFEELERLASTTNSSDSMGTPQPTVKHLTVLTDFASSAAHPWIQDKRQTVCVGTPQAYGQAVDFGIPKQAIHHLSGMVVDPKFYRPMSQEHKAQLIADLKLNPDLPTVLVLFGGFPPTALCMELIKKLGLRSLFKSAAIPEQILDACALRSPVNVILVCGKNNDLFHKATEEKKRQMQEHAVGNLAPEQYYMANTFVEGYSERVPELMKICQVVIGKPGPGVVSESIVSQVPIFLYLGDKESYVMEQEADVATYVIKHGVGRGGRSVDDLILFSPDELCSYRRNIQSLPANQAVFEVFRVLEVEAKVRGKLNQ